MKRAGALSLQSLALVICLVALVGASRAIPAAEPPVLIPQPAMMRLGMGEFVLASNTHILHGGPLEPVEGAATHLAEVFRREYGLGVHFPSIIAASARMPHAILITTEDADPDLGEEGYSLRVTPDLITIRANAAPGAFYAVQTLRQLLPEPGAERLAIPAVHIVDQPAFAWRGLMLDCSRHFMEKDFVIEVLDLMAYHKLNRFHWHLIDYNGWRLEIDKYPLLTEIAAWRGEGENRYGGFYSKDDVREILAHAASRHIMVIPEIEMPGHSNASLYAYPHLTCAGEPFPVGRGGLAHYTAVVGGLPYCAGREETFEFLQDIIDEVVELFPAPYLHVGGDERPKGIWEKCPRCQARMAEQDLADEHELQTWFMRRISDYVTSKGRRPISWAVTRSDPYKPTDMDDLGNDAIIQNWHDGTVFAVRQGWNVINSINGYVYFDYPEFPGMDKPSWMPLLNLERVYQFEPVPAGLRPQEASLIWGGEACLWTEMLPQDKVLPALFPRLLALAEVTWTYPRPRDFPQFEGRVKRHEPRLARMGVDYGRPPQ